MQRYLSIPFFAGYPDLVAGTLSDPSYDLMGDVLTLTDPDSNTTSWSYDGLGRPIQESESVALGYKAGTTTSLGTGTAVYNNQFDLDGNLIQSSDPDGRVNTYSYDWASRQTGETWYASAAQAAAGVSDGSITYTFDIGGAMIGATNSVNSTAVATYLYQHDDVYNTTLETASLNGLSSNVLLAWNYDYNKCRTALSVNIGGTANFYRGEFTGFSYGTNDFTNAYTYDHLENMTSVSQTSQTTGNGVTSKTVTFGYDADNRLTGTAAYAAAFGSIGSGNEVYSSAWAFDHDSNLTALTYSPQGNTSATPLAAYHWDYDNDNRVVDMYSRNDSSAPSPNQTYGSGSNWGEAAYSYDHDSQLTATTYSNFYNAAASNRSATFDADGNRTNHGAAGSANRLLSDGTYDYTYDLDGNRIARTRISDLAVTYYQWNNENQLTAVSGAGGEAAYSYDAFGRMVSQTENGATSYFIDDGQNVALVMNVVNGYANVVERELYGPAVDQVLASEFPPAVPSGGGPQSSGPVNWLLGDNQGTIRDVATYNGTTTGIVNHLVFDSFGQFAWESSSLPANQTRFTYAGMQLDPVSGLYYDNARWYDALNGVFISQDPLGFAAGDPNTSRYCFNSPTNGTDPSGMDEWGAAEPEHNLFTDFCFFFFSNDQAASDPCQQQSEDPDAPGFIAQSPKVGALEKSTTTMGTVTFGAMGAEGGMLVGGGAGAGVGAFGAMAGSNATATEIAGGILGGYLGGKFGALVGGLGGPAGEEIGGFGGGVGGGYAGGAAAGKVVRIVGSKAGGCGGNPGPGEGAPIEEQPLQEQQAQQQQGKATERVTNPKHHPNSASPEPTNAQELFDNSIVDSKGVRWAKDADGTIHRFSKPSNGQSHWNGSTGGADPIRLEDIPIAIRRALR